MSFFLRVVLALMISLSLCLYSLPASSNADTLQKWADQLQSEIKEQSAQAALSLLQLDTDEAITILKTFLLRPGCPFNNQHIGVRFERKLTQRLIAALLPVIQEDREKYTDEGFCAVQILRLAETQDTAAKSALVDYAKGQDLQNQQDDDRYRAWAVAALKNYNGQDVLSVLIHIAQTGRPRSKAAAIYALGEIRHPSAVDPLLQILQSYLDPCVTTEKCDDKKALIDALAKLEDQRAIEPIIAVLKSQETHKIVRKKALEALEKLNVPSLQRF